MKAQDFSFLVLAEHELVLEEFVGPITAKNLPAFLNTLWSDPTIQPHFNGIIDVRRARLEMTPQEVKAFMKEENEDDSRANGIAVLIAEAPNSVAISMLYQFYSAAQKVEIVENLEDAFAFFGLNADTYCRQDRMVV